MPKDPIKDVELTTARFLEGFSQVFSRLADSFKSTTTTLVDGIKSLINSMQSKLSAESLGGIPGFWASLKDGSLRNMWRNLIDDIQKFKGVVGLTTLATLALNREMEINKLRTFTDSLQSGSKELEGFYTAVEKVTSKYGMAFDEVANRAALIRKSLFLAFDTETFEKYLDIQSKVIKSTGMSDAVLNRLFLSIRMGTVDNERFIKVTKEMSQALIGLSGKAGVTQEDLAEFSITMENLSNAMLALGATPEAVSKAMIQWKNALAGLSEIGLKDVIKKLHAAVSDYESNPESFNLLANLGPRVFDAARLARYTGDYSQVLESALENIRSKAMAVLSAPPGTREFTGEKIWLDDMFGKGMANRILAAVRTGRFDQVRKEILNNLNLQKEKGPIEDLMKSLTTSLARIRNSLESIGAQIGQIPLDIVANMLEKVANAVTQLFNRFKELPIETQKSIAVLVTLGLSAMALFPIVGLLAGSFMNIIGVVKLLAPAIGMLLRPLGWLARLAVAPLGLLAGLGPAGWVVIGIGAAITAVVLLTKYWNELSDAVSAGAELLRNAWEAIRSGMESLGLKWLADELELIGNAFLGIGKVVYDVGSAIGQFGAWIYGMGKAFLDSHPILEETLSYLFPVHTILTMIWEVAKNIYGVFRSIGEAVKEIGLNNITEYAGMKLGSAKDWISKKIFGSTPEIEKRQLEREARYNEMVQENQRQIAAKEEAKAPLTLPPSALYKGYPEKLGTTVEGAYRVLLSERPKGIESSPAFPGVIKISPESYKGYPEKLGTVVERAYGIPLSERPKGIEPPEVEKSALQALETSTPAFRELKIEAPAKEPIEVRSFDEFMTIVKKFYEMYQNDRNQDSIKNPFLLQSMTRSEAEAFIERIRFDDAWGGVVA